MEILAPANRDAGRNVPTWVAGFLAAACSGVLMALSFQPFGSSLTMPVGHILAWVALVPWLVAIPRLSPRSTWLLGTCLGMAFYRVGLDWSFSLYGPLAGLVVVGLSAWMGLSFRVARMLMQRLGAAAMLWVVPLTFVGQEVLRSEALPRYRFAYLAYGYSQAENLWIAQTASVGGVYFLSFLLVASNAAVAYGLLRRCRGAWLPAAGLAGLAIAVGAIAQPGPVESRPTVRVACVQSETTDDREYVELTRQALALPEKPAFVVLPEHALEGFADLPHPTVDRLATLAREHRAYVCVGAHVRAPPNDECLYDNVGLFIGPDGKVIGWQAKCVPVPFIQDGYPAREQRVLETQHGRVGILICYDGDFTDFPRRIVSLGAELLLVPVMNPESWPVQQRRQQADMAVFRSIELRRCAVRAATSGTSQIVDATGRVLAERPQEHGPGLIAAAVHFADEQTLFTRGGHYFASAAGYAFLALIILLTAADWTGKTAAPGPCDTARSVTPCG